MNVLALGSEQDPIKISCMAEPNSTIYLNGQSQQIQAHFFSPKETKGITHQYPTELDINSL